mmetsp:Transcript_20898/g.52997  ORF Transcript_20898/g.52997 Transcript_20898/m.52997 type:complete len:228 (-) Transcript_20898:675-1358(-)
MGDFSGGRSKMARARASIHLRTQTLRMQTLSRRLRAPRPTRLARAKRAGQWTRSSSPNCARWLPLRRRHRRARSRAQAPPPPPAAHAALCSCYSSSSCSRARCAACFGGAGGAASAQAGAMRCMRRTTPCTTQPQTTARTCRSSRRSRRARHRSVSRRACAYRCSSWWRGRVPSRGLALAASARRRRWAWGASARATWRCNRTSGGRPHRAYCNCVRHASSGGTRRG